MAGVGRTVFGAAAEREGRQFETLYTLSSKRGKQDFRFGGEYQNFDSRSSEDGHFAYSPNVLTSYYSSVASVVSPGIDALLAGVPLGLTSSDGAYPYFNPQKFSIFAEDSLRVTERFSVLLGLRWDVTFPLNNSYGLVPASFNVGYWRGPGSLPEALTNGFFSPPILLSVLAPALRAGCAASGAGLSIEFLQSRRARRRRPVL